MSSTSAAPQTPSVFSGSVGIAAPGLPGTPPALFSEPLKVTPAESALAESSRPGTDVWQVGSLTRDVLNLALQARACATSSGVVPSPGALTIIDYSKPSTEPRLWVIDVDRHELLYEERVAHGRNTGRDLAVRFSNTPESFQSSLGLFVTEDAYVGDNGYSLRLNGLDRGFNDRARERAIVMHGAPYVNAQVAKVTGRLGRSLGCPAVREPIARELIDRVKGGSLVFAYYPDTAWLESSAFLGGCNAG